MNLSSTARSVVVAAAVAATAGFGLGAAFSSHSTAAADTQPAGPMVATSEPVYQHSHPRRLTPEMRRYLAGKGSTTETDAKAWRRADGTVHEVAADGNNVRILPHDVKGP